MSNVYHAASPSDARSPMPHTVARLGQTARLVSLGTVLATLLALGANWPQFRGPGSAGQSDEQGLPVTWSDNEGVLWKTQLPGAGSSSPITWGDRVLVTGFSGYGQNEADDDADSGDSKEAAAKPRPEDLKLHVTCLDRQDGKVLWDKTIDAKGGERSYGGFVRRHGYASGTPATDGDAVYANFGRSGVVAYDLQGNLLWQADLGDGTHSFGSGTSPVLFDDLVIVNAFVECGKLIALDKKTGQRRWEADGLKRAWSTPVLVEVDGHSELVLNSEGEILAFDPATGKSLWKAKGISDYICPSVIAHEGVVYAIGGRSTKAVAVRAGGEGDVTDTRRLWETSKGSKVSSPVYHEGHLYLADTDGGKVICLDAKDGKVVFEVRLEPRPGEIYASSLLVDGKIYFVSREKGTFVVAARPEFELLAHNTLESDKSIFNASPAVSDGQLLLRSDRALYCLGKE